MGSKKIISLWILVSFFSSMIAPNIFAAYDYQKYNQKKLTELFDRAKTAKDEGVYQQIVNTGLSVIEAGWEQDFDAYIKEQGIDPQQALLEKQEEQKKLKQELADKAAQEQKNWKIKQEAKKIIEEQNGQIQEFQAGIETKVKDYILQYYDGRDEGIKNLFNQYLETEANTSKTELLNTLKENLQTKLANLEGYHDGIDQTVDAVYKEWDIDLSNILIRNNNKFNTETSMDIYSLKANAEKEDAELVVGNVLNQTQSGLKTVESNIFDMIQNQVNFQEAGNGSYAENISIELRKELEKGINLWNQARQDLVNQYEQKLLAGNQLLETGIQEWENVFEKLLKERNTWIEKTRSQIEQGFAEWENKTNEMNANFTDIQNKLSEYLSDKQENWETYGQQVFQNLASANSMVSDIEKQLVWMDETVKGRQVQIADELAQKNAQLTSVVNNGQYVFKNNENAVVVTSRDFTAQEIYSSPLMVRVLGYNPMDYIMAGFCWDMGCVPAIPPAYANYSLPGNTWATGNGTKTQYYCNGYPIADPQSCSYSDFPGVLTSSVVADPTVMNASVKLAYQELLGMNYVMVNGQPVLQVQVNEAFGSRWVNTGGVWKLSADGVSYKKTTYQISVDQANHLMLLSGAVNNAGMTSVARWMEEIQVYQNEKVNVTNLRNQLLTSFASMEDMYLNQGLNPYNQSAADGVLSSETANNSDMYMMSNAEFEFEQSKNEYEYFRKRLLIAQAVYEYAAADSSLRDTAAETLQKMQNAQQVLQTKKNEYNNLTTLLGSFENGQYQTEYQKQVITTLPNGEKEVSYVTETLTLEALRQQVAATQSDIQAMITALDGTDQTDGLKDQYNNLLKQMLLAQNASVKEGYKKEGFTAYSDYTTLINDYFDAISRINFNRGSEGTSFLQSVFGKESASNQNPDTLTRENGVMESYVSSKNQLAQFTSFTGYNNGFLKTAFSYLDSASIDYENQSKLSNMLGVSVENLKTYYAGDWNALNQHLYQSYNSLKANYSNLETGVSYIYDKYVSGSAQAVSISQAVVDSIAVKENNLTTSLQNTISQSVVDIYSEMETNIIAGIEATLTGKTGTVKTKLESLKDNFTLEKKFTADDLKAYALSLGLSSLISDELETNLLASGLVSDYDTLKQNIKNQVSANPEDALMNGFIADQIQTFLETGSGVNESELKTNFTYLYNVFENQWDNLLDSAFLSLMNEFEHNAKNFNARTLDLNMEDENGATTENSIINSAKTLVEKVVAGEIPLTSDIQSLYENAVEKMTLYVRSGGTELSGWKYLSAISDPAGRAPEIETKMQMYSLLLNYNPATVTNSLDYFAFQDQAAFDNYLASDLFFQSTYTALQTAEKNSLLNLKKAIAEQLDQLDGEYYLVRAASLTSVPSVSMKESIEVLKTWDASQVTVQGYTALIQNASNAVEETKITSFYLLAEYLQRIETIVNQAGVESAKLKVGSIIGSLVFKNGDGSFSYKQSNVLGLQIDANGQVQSGFSLNTFTQDQFQTEMNQLNQTIQAMDHKLQLADEASGKIKKSIQNYQAAVDSNTQGLEEIQNAIDAKWKEIQEKDAALKLLNEKMDKMQAGLNQTHAYYIDLMNQIDNQNKQVEDAKLQYDIAYEVYEYANTPYLQAEGEESSRVDAKQVYEEALAKFTDSETRYNQLKNELAVDSDPNWRARYVEAKINELKNNPEYMSRWTTYENQVDALVSASNLLQAVEQRTQSLQASVDAKKSEVDTYVSQMFGYLSTDKMIEALGEDLYEEFIGKMGSYSFNNYLYAMDRYYRNTLAQVDKNGNVAEQLQRIFSAGGTGDPYGIMGMLQEVSGGDIETWNGATYTVTNCYPNYNAQGEFIGGETCVNTVLPDNRKQLIYNMLSQNAATSHVHQSLGEGYNDDTLTAVFSKLSSYQGQNLMGQFDFYKNYSDLYLQYLGMMNRGGAVGKDSSEINGFLEKYKDVFGNNLWSPGYFHMTGTNYKAREHWYQAKAQPFYKVWLGEGHVIHNYAMARWRADVDWNYRVPNSTRVANVEKYTHKEKLAYQDLHSLRTALESESKFQLNLADIDVNDPADLNQLRDKLAACLGVYNQQGEYTKAIQIIGALNADNDLDKLLLSQTFSEVTLRGKSGYENGKIDFSYMLSSAVKILSGLNSRSIGDMKGYMRENNLDETLFLRERLALISDKAWGPSESQKISVVLGNASNLSGIPNTSGNLTTTMSFYHRQSSIYNTLTQDMIYGKSQDYENGYEEGIGQESFQLMISQQVRLKQQEWGIKQSEFYQDQNQWKEKVYEIFDRGVAAWDQELNRFKSEWQTWIDTTKNKMTKLESAAKVELASFDKKAADWASKSYENAAKGIAVEFSQDQIDAVKSKMTEVIEKSVDFGSKEDLKTQIDKMSQDVLSKTSSLGIPSFMFDKAKMADTNFTFSMMKDNNLLGAMQNQMGATLNQYQATIAKMNNLKIMENMEKLVKQSRDSIIKQDQEYFDKVVPGFMNREFGYQFNGSSYYREVVESVTLIGVDYKTQYIGAYQKYKVPDVTIDIKVLNKDRDVVQFSPSSVVELSDIEMNTVYDIATAQVNLQIEKIEKEFQENVDRQISSDEGAKGIIIQAVEAQEEERIKAEAGFSASFWDIPIAPGFPLSIGSITKIAASIVLTATGAGALLAAGIMATMSFTESIARGNNFWSALGGATMQFATSMIPGGDTILGSIASNFAKSTLNNVGGRLLSGQGFSSWKDFGNMMAGSAVQGIAGGLTSTIGKGDFLGGREGGFWSNLGSTVIRDTTTGALGGISNRLVSGEGFDGWKDFGNVVGLGAAKGAISGTARGLATGVVNQIRIAGNGKSQWDVVNQTRNYQKGSAWNTFAANLTDKAINGIGNVFTNEIDRVSLKYEMKRKNPKISDAEIEKALNDKGDWKKAVMTQTSEIIVSGVKDLTIMGINGLADTKWSEKDGKYKTDEGKSKSEQQYYNNSLQSFAGTLGEVGGRLGANLVINAIANNDNYKLDVYKFKFSHVTDTLGFLWDAGAKKTVEEEKKAEQDAANKKTEEANTQTKINVDQKNEEVNAQTQANGGQNLKKEKTENGFLSSVGNWLVTAGKNVGNWFVTAGKNLWATITGEKKMEVCKNGYDSSGRCTDKGRDPFDSTKDGNGTSEMNFFQAYQYYNEKNRNFTHNSQKNPYDIWSTIKSFAFKADDFEAAVGWAANEFIEDRYYFKEKNISESSLRTKKDSELKASEERIKELTKKALDKDKYELKKNIYSRIY